MQLLNTNYVYYGLFQARVKVYDLERNLEAQTIFFWESKFKLVISSTCIVIHCGIK